jgi:protein TonB
MQIVTDRRIIVNLERHPSGAEETRGPLTANDRFKKSFGMWLWGSMILATVLHFSLFAFWPEMSAQDFSFNAEELTAIDLPPEIEIPPPPEAIARPATPVIDAAAIDEDITIAPTTWEDNPVADLPPPPTVTTNTDLSAAPTFTPFTVRPEVKNRQELTRAMEREYPALLRDAGIGGQVIVHFFIDENGVVQNAVLAESSGHSALDQAALRIAPIIEFTPALNRDRQVPVWTRLPITFNAR